MTHLGELQGYVHVIKDSICLTPFNAYAYSMNYFYWLLIKDELRVIEVG